MARRPPIIISNGGMASALTKNLVPAPGQTKAADKIIMDNVAELNAAVNDESYPSNTRPVARRLRKDRSRDTTPAKIYWRLESEDPHSKETGSDAR